jgi:hypothetical protein
MLNPLILAEGLGLIPKRSERNPTWFFPTSRSAAREPYVLLNYIPSAARDPYYRKELLTAVTISLVARVS